MIPRFLAFLVLVLLMSSGNPLSLIGLAQAGSPDDAEWMVLNSALNPRPTLAATQWTQAMEAVTPESTPGLSWKIVGLVVGSFFAFLIGVWWVAYFRRANRINLRGQQSRYLGLSRRK